MRKSYLLMLFISVLMTGVTHSNAQTINAPILNVPYACASPVFNSYIVTTSYTAPGFGPGNTFYLELSDASGDFGNPTILASTTTQNYPAVWSFAFNSVSFPTSVVGNNLRMRVRSTQPAKTSTPSAPFSFFYYDNQNLTLNNFQPVVLCEGSSATITTSPDTYSQYTWYRNGVKISGETGPSLTVSEAGNYFAEVYLGPCNINLPTSISNNVKVSIANDFDVSITNGTDVDICPNEEYRLKLDVDDNTYTYQWFKDGQPISNRGYYPEWVLAAADDKKGVYYAEVGISSVGCTTRSGDLKVRYKKEFNVNSGGPEKVTLLPGQSKTISIETDATNPTIVWYKDGVMYAENNDKTLLINEEGDFEALVTSEADCGLSKRSPKIVVKHPTSYTVQINTKSDYQTCESKETTLQIASLEARYPFGVTEKVAEADYELFNFQWVKDGMPIEAESSSNGEGSGEGSGEENPYYDNINKSFIVIPDFSFNGDYQLQVQLDTNTSLSNIQVVQLGFEVPEISAPTTSICRDELVELAILPMGDDFSYQWLLDTLPISGATQPQLQTNKVGFYSLQVVGNGCTVVSETIEIKPINKDAVSLSPGDAITITEGGSQEVSASGADTYQWFDANNQLLSTTDRYLADTEGSFYVKARLGDCEVVRNFTVEYRLSGRIPNVITVNGDGINERWNIPRVYRKDNVEVTMYRADGKLEFSKTNYQGDWPQNIAFNTQQQAPVYYYIIKQDGSIIKRGSVTVIH
ncbi:T9SS type B sorting domain-containing protein [Croceiramulus getboli]|nr:gliding motility-associated C-terminal domain-containing protein [Flavobacteriaceae bacterium YJPT1-3]